MGLSQAVTNAISLEMSKVELREYILAREEKDIDFPPFYEG